MNVRTLDFAIWNLCFEANDDGEVNLPGAGFFYSRDFAVRTLMAQERRIK